MAQSRAVPCALLCPQRPRGSLFWQTLPVHLSTSLHTHLPRRRISNPFSLPISSARAGCSGNDCGASGDGGICKVDVRSWMKNQPMSLKWPYLTARAAKLSYNLLNRNHEPLRAARSKSPLALKSSLALLRCFAGQDVACPEPDSKKGFPRHNITSKPSSRYKSPLQSGTAKDGLNCTQSTQAR